MTLADPAPAASTLDDGRRVVPEPAVKALLAARGVPVPRSGRAVPDDAPLVLKAYGAGIVHKSDLGAVDVGVQPADVVAAIDAMRARLAVHGVHDASFFVEELVRPGVELLVGVVDRGFGPMLAVGLGGTLVELLDDVSLRCAPASPAMVREMLDELRGAPLLRGVRGGPEVDLDALVDAVVGIQDVALGFGDELAELECNPVIARPDGVCAADARLLLRPAAAPATAPEARPATDFARLFSPRGVAVAGASATKESFGNRFLAAYRDYGWTDGLVALHPTATEIDGVPAYASLHDVPFAVDYVVAAVPAPACPQLVRDAASAGDPAAGDAPFVHVISGGFGEMGESGRGLEHDLRAAARETGVRVLGPNCMGAFSPAGRQTFQLGAPTTAGHVSVISQSGGLAGDIVKLGDVHGVRFAKLVTVGNCVDVTVGELLGWLVDDPDTRVVGLYVEDPRDGAALVAAARRASGRVPIVALVGGLSRQGAHAVASHTGSLAGDERVWRAIAASTGVTVVRTLDELVSTLAALQADVERPPAAATYRDTTLVVGVGGGASVLATDACDRAGLTVVAVRDDVQAELRSMGYGAGTSVANPIEIPFGPAAPLDAFARVLAPILATQPYADVILHVNVQAFFSFGSDGAAKLLLVPGAIADLAEAWPSVRFAFVPRNLDCAPPETAAALVAASRARGVRVFPMLDLAALAVAAAQRFDRWRAARTGG